MSHCLRLCCTLIQCPMPLHCYCFTILIMFTLWSQCDYYRSIGSVFTPHPGSINIQPSQPFGRFLSGGIILGPPSPVPTYSYTQQPCLQLAVTHPRPFLILLLKWRQEYSYRLRNRPIASTIVYFTQYAMLLCDIGVLSDLCIHHDFWRLTTTAVTKIMIIITATM